MYIPLSTSDGWRRGIYGSINWKKFMKPSFDQPKNISEDQTRNPKIFFFASGYFTAHSILHSTAPIVWLTTSIFPDCCKIIFLPWAVFHSTVNQCILNSYAMITHHHYERLGYFDDQQVLYDEHSGDYQDVFDARATWFRSFILMPCFIQSIPRYTRVVTIQCRHYIG